MLGILLKLNKIIIVFLLFIIQIPLDLSYAQSSKIQKQNIAQSKEELFQKNILYVIPNNNSYNGLSKINKSFCVPVSQGIQGSTSDNVSTYEQESIAWHTHKFYGVPNWAAFLPTISDNNTFDSNFVNPLKLNEQIQEIQGFTPNVNKRGYLNIKLKTNKNINISLNGDVISWSENQEYNKYNVSDKIPYMYYAIENPYRPVRKQIFINQKNPIESGFHDFALLENVQNPSFTSSSSIRSFNYGIEEFSIPSITFNTWGNTHTICKK